MKFSIYDKGKDMIKRMDRYCCYFEKYKNLIMWQNPILVSYILGLMFIFCIFISIYSVKLPFASGISYMFIKGYKWKDKKLKNNREITKAIVR